MVASFENDYFGFTQLQIDGSGNRGCLEEYAADGSLTWRLRLETDDYIHHHDAVKLPDGNVLALVWEYIYDDGAKGPHMLFRANRYPADHPAVTALINGDIP